MIDAIIEFMTTYHEGGRLGAYGWVYMLIFVLIFAGSIGSALAARELLERRKRVQVRASTLSTVSLLKAAAVVEQDGSTRMLEGQFRSIGGTYELTLRESVDGSQSESIHTFASIEQLEHFLESNTILRLGDFTAG